MCLTALARVKGVSSSVDDTATRCLPHPENLADDSSLDVTTVLISSAESGTALTALKCSYTKRFPPRTSHDGFNSSASVKV